jgi:hypothetical protein
VVIACPLAPAPSYTTSVDSNTSILRVRLEKPSWCGVATIGRAQQVRLGCAE